MSIGKMLLALYVSSQHNFYKLHFVSVMRW